MPSESEPATREAGRGRINTLSWLLATLGIVAAVLGPLSAERYWLLCLSMAPVALLVLEWRTTPSVAGQPRRRHLLPIFPLAHGVLSITLQAWLFGRNDVQTVLIYAFFILAPVVTGWQLLKFGGLDTGSRRPRIDIS